MKQRGKKFKFTKSVKRQTNNSKSELLTPEF